MNQKNVGVVDLGDPKKQKGITLIALIITIIVLLILAGVTISMVLGDDGIIAQAQEAKKQNEESSLKDAISVAKADAATYKYVKQTPMSVTDLNADLGTSKTENTTVAKVVEGVPIPMGFAYVEGTKKDTGLIVVDGYGNEYVWVPVDTSSDNETPMFTKDAEGNYKGKLYDWQSWSGTGNPNGLLDSSYLEPSVEPNSNNITDNMQEEYNEMAASVETYGGFYVGRYETSWTGNRVASVANVEPINGNTPVDEIDLSYDSDSDGKGSNWYTFYTKQKELYNKESDSVVSGMIYGSQWDAIMDWMSDVKNVTDESKLYICDSTDMGNYSSSTPIKTGSNSNYRVKNIFDLAGNYSEWTQTAFVEYGDNRVERGGDFYWDATTVPASGFFALGDAAADVTWDCFTSRLQLYIK